MPSQEWEASRLAVRVKRQGRDMLHVALQGRHLALRGHVPDLNARVGAGDGQALPVRMPGDDLVAHRADGQVRERGPRSSRRTRKRRSS